MRKRRTPRRWTSDRGPERKARVPKPGTRNPPGGWPIPCRGNVWDRRPRCQVLRFELRMDPGPVQ